MPVRFKGMSEYKKHYNWHDSFRSKSFQPSAEQEFDPAGKSSSTSEYNRQFAPHHSQSEDVQMAKQVAGINSECLAMSYEPPMQHKKRIDGPPTSLSTNFYEHSTRDAEYTLLGNQEKFAENVLYNAKNPKSKPKIYKNKENMDEEAPPNKQLRMQKRIKPLMKERHPPISPPRKSYSQDAPSIQSPPPAPRVEKSLPVDEVKYALKDKDLKDVLGESLDKPAKIAVKQDDLTAKAVVNRSLDVGKKAEVSQMNESVQTNMKKGVALSAPEAPAEYSLKYKAGVAPPRPVKKFSEYQKQFQWKNGKKASPLLAAEQIVYSSNTELGPYKNEAIPKISEYKRNFQPWKPIDVKRSKSAAAVLRKEKPNESVVTEDGAEAEELKEKLKKSHGKIRRLGTEYQANFKSPTCYYHKSGAWKGADPPQLMPGAEEKKVVEEKKNKSAEESVPASNWYAEVMELRRRAEEYRKRAQGTHFSREHLVQLMAKQNDCWDLDSQASSTVRALNLEAPVINRRVAKEKPASPLLSDVEIEDLEEEVELSEPCVKKAMSPDEHKMMRLKADKVAVSQQEIKMKEQAKKEMEAEFGEDGDDDDDVAEEDEGRQPTPKLKQVKKSSSRHHLDLTTPAVGGALLTCPPSKNSKMIVTSRSGDSYVTASDNMEVPQVQKKVDLEKLNTRPILGHPSGDTHALRDDDASTDRALNTRYIPSPAFVIGSDEDKENAPGKKGDKSSKCNKAAKPSMLTPVQEGAGKTYLKSKPFLTLDDIRSNEGQGPSGDDDVMSVSMMSVASSASLASEVLERARRRQKEFWGKGDA